MFTRKDFIKFLLFIQSLFFLHPLTKIFPKTKRIFLFDFYIAGYQYYDGCDIEDNLKIGDELIIKREPKNEFDPKAIEVYTKDSFKLGYVPRAMNKIPSHVADQDVELTAEILKINFEEPEWKRVKVRLYEII